MYILMEITMFKLISLFYFKHIHSYNIKLHIKYFHKLDELNQNVNQLIKCLSLVILNYCKLLNIIFTTFVMLHVNPKSLLIGILFRDLFQNKSISIHFMKFILYFIV